MVWGWIVEERMRKKDFLPPRSKYQLLKWRCAMSLWNGGYNAGRSCMQGYQLIVTWANFVVVELSRNRIGNNLKVVEIVNYDNKNLQLNEYWCSSITMLFLCNLHDNWIFVVCVYRGPTETCWAGMYDPTWCWYMVSLICLCQLRYFQVECILSSIFQGIQTSEYIKGVLVDTWLMSLAPTNGTLWWHARKKPHVREKTVMGCLKWLMQV